MGDRFVHELPPLEPEKDEQGDSRFVHELPPLVHEGHGAPQGHEEPPAPEEHKAPERGKPWYDHLLDGATSFADGALLHHGGELADHMGRAASALGLTPNRDKAEHAPDELARLVDRASNEHPVANAAGGLAMGAIGGAAVPGGMAAQGAMAGAQGILDEHGRTGDPTRMAASGLTSAALGAGGALVGKLAGKAIGGSAPHGPQVPPGPAASAVDSLSDMKFGPSTPKYAYQADPKLARISEADPLHGLLAQGAGVAGRAMSGSRLIGQGAKYVASKLLGAPRPRATFPMAAPGAQAGGALGGQGGQALGQAAQPPEPTGTDKAYATPQVSQWVQKKVLSSPSSGLPPEAAQQLGQAVMSGDPRQVAALSYQLRQRYPEYARQIEKGLRSLNGESSE